MPRTKSLAWSQLKLGIVGVIAIALAMALILAVGGQAGFWWERYTLHTQFPNAAGMKSGAVVRVAGKDIGKVTAVEFAPGGKGVDITMDIHEDVQSLITTESRASMGSLSLLGEPIVEISPSQAGSPLPNGGFVPAVPATGSIAEVASTAGVTLGEANKILERINRGEGTAGKIFTDEKLYADAQSLLNAVDAVVRNVQRGGGTIGQLMQNPRAYREAEASLANLRTLTDRINRGEGSLGAFLKDDAIAKSVAATSANIEAITGRINRGEGTLGKALTDDQMWQRFTAVTVSLEKMIAELQAGQGTAGKFLKNDELYENMNRTVIELREFLAEVKKDPKKYLNIRVSIF